MLFISVVIPECQEKYRRTPRLLRVFVENQKKTDNIWNLMGNHASFISFY